LYLVTLLTLVNVSSNKQDAQKNVAARLNYYHTKALQGLQVPIQSRFRRLVSRLPATSWAFPCAYVVLVIFSK